LGAGTLAASFRSFYDSFWRHYHFHAPARWAARFEAAGLQVLEVTEYGSRDRCTFHDLLVPLALPAHLVKTWSGRYFLLPALRRWVVRLARSLLPADRPETVLPGTGGLVCIRAVRPDPGPPRSA
ncbi:MAG: hypothetical protein HY553_20195, partial [Elusimicrobia bacterium]|nr:hypothetical protein [Elusimicrobiota bacterium]